MKYYKYLAIFLLFFCSNSNAAVVQQPVTDYIVGITDVAVNGKLFDVTWKAPSQIDIAAQATLWATEDEFITARDALLSQLDTAGFDYVCTEDGLLNNNDFYVVRSMTQADRLRGESNYDWSFYSTNTISDWNRVGWPTAVFEFQGGPAVPVPNTIILLGIGLLSISCFRRTQK